MKKIKTACNTTSGLYFLKSYVVLNLFLKQSSVMVAKVDKARGMPSSGMLRRVVLVRTDVSEELSTSIIRVTRIGDLRTLAINSKRRTLLKLLLVHQFLSS
jgi:hypothetical protein